MNKTIALLAVLLMTVIFFSCRKDSPVVQPNNNNTSDSSNVIDTAALIHDIGGSRYWTGTIYNYFNGNGTSANINDTFEVVRIGNSLLAVLNDTLPFDRLDTLNNSVIYSMTSSGWPTTIHIELNYYYQVDSLYYIYSSQSGLGGYSNKYLYTQ